jgi:hypothetical protein
MEKKNLSSEQAFRAMFLFLNAYYDRTQGKSELASVLSDIQLDPDSGSPADPATWEDWLAAVNAACPVTTRRG